MNKYEWFWWVLSNRHFRQAFDLQQILAIEVNKKKSKATDEPHIYAEIEKEKSIDWAQSIGMMCKGQNDAAHWKINQKA